MYTDFTTFSPTLAFEEMRLPLELYAACLLFTLPQAPKKNHFIARLLCCFAAGALLSQLFFVIFVDKAAPRFLILYGFWYPFLGLTAVAMTRFCFEITLSDALFTDICAYTTQDIVYVLVHELIARYWVPALRLHLGVYITSSALGCAAIYTIVYFFFRPQLQKKMQSGPGPNCTFQERKNKLLDDNWRNLLFYLVFYVLMIVMFDFFQGMFNNMDFELHELTALFEMLVCCFILITQYSIIAARNSFAENARLLQFINNSAKYYEMSKEQVEIINRKCHDLKHTLKALAVADDAERKTYIEEAQKDIMFYQQLVHSDNEVINTILAEKSLVCSEKGISLSCAIDSVDLSFIRLTDLYALLGNALDNAIEYVDKNNEASDRTISLRITRNHAFLSIQVTNPYHGPVMVQGALPKTTKHNANDHGYGLKSIRYLARQYGGEMGIDTKDQLFTLQIMLPLGVTENRSM